MNLLRRGRAQSERVMLGTAGLRPAKAGNSPESAAGEDSAR